MSRSICAVKSVSMSASGAPLEVEDADEGKRSVILVT